MRNIIETPSFTQGAFFNGLKLNQEKTSKAIIISARCDIANEKAHHILCLPVFKLKDWLLYSGDKIIFKNVFKTLVNKINQDGRKFGVTTSTIDTFPLKISLSKAPANSELLGLIKCYKKQECCYEFSFMKKAKSKVIEEIINNQNMSYFFVEKILESEPLDPHIIDISNPISIPFIVAKSVSEKINRKKYTDNDIFHNYLNFDSDILKIQSNLSSPYVELLLQKFSNYYSRIGTENLSDLTKINLKGFYE